ncbi:hypothetical protein ASPWEDRAFT_27364 [Aspergillus wentii DTO 134E9]|uniref:Uncharacterized protein n=1 Tax=Aspergillus wentii DTO 134E9 TaxID=1073089 RepID=A0A1L9RIG3_ASPWE|nr:uncharacterized protein ASPWEDRAFT_27364 [Aspergillus wentii DTO 134E9]KAI9932371.1 hypothetical protein MW887_009884 [Aspergillus wentii]OJJ34663.1 hypothetical protein ASPWEDRAFT_27364 [Aspergillus wentii DTO 134E9]
MSSRRTVSPKYDARRPGRVYASPSPERYHGRHFEKSPAQEQYWNSRGSTEVWDPLNPVNTKGLAPRPATNGLAHSYHDPILETQYSDPYKKRPNPYTARTKADYAAYKGPSEGHGAIADKVASYKDMRIGRKVSPHEHHRASLYEGQDLAVQGRNMANIAAQSRTGFDHKYPQAYEDHAAIGRHVEEANKQRRSARNFREDDAFLDEKIGKWKERMDIHGKPYGPNRTR